MSSLRWEDPPPPRGKYGHLADELASRPGEWALVKDQLWEGNQAYQLAAYLRKRYGLAASVRRHTNGSWRVYAQSPS